MLQPPKDQVPRVVIAPHVKTSHITVPTVHCFCPDIYAQQMITNCNDYIYNIFQHAGILTNCVLVYYCLLILNVTL